MRKGSGMAQSVAPRVGTSQWSVWTVSAATVLLASAAIAVVLWEPRALWIALACGGLVLVGTSLRERIRARARARVGAGSAAANAGIALSVLVIIPLIAFALLWVSLLALLGVAWILRAVGLA